MANTAEQIEGWIGRNLVDAYGEKIGKINDIYVDEQTGEPEWLAVNTGLFGTSVSFVPLTGATRVGDDLQVQVAKDQVRDAPTAAADGQLTYDEEARLYAYYGLSYGQPATTAAPTTAAPATAAPPMAAPATAAPATGATDNAMTRSEERLNVGTERVQTGRARLRKYIVTENQTMTVPVEREEVRLEREPITDANIGDAMSGPDLSEDEHEVTLTEERPVVNKETVPVERVRLDTDTVTENREVSEEVRKEQIDFDGESGRDRV